MKAIKPPQPAPADGNRRSAAGATERQVPTGKRILMGAGAESASAQRPAFLTRSRGAPVSDGVHDK
jgi:hypothetical protein